MKQQDKHNDVFIFTPTDRIIVRTVRQYGVWMGERWPTVLVSLYSVQDCGPPRAGTATGYRTGKYTV